MNLTPDQIVLWQWGPIRINATLMFTWLVMLVLVGGSRLVTRRLSCGVRMSRMQNLCEVVVSFVRSQLNAIGGTKSQGHMPFIATLFVFIAASNLLDAIPGCHPPTASLSTTAALALCVFAAVPISGISTLGLMGFLGNYAKPSIFMLPFNIMGELSQTVALAIRLFGNIMSGAMISGILLSVTPLFFPVIMHAFGLLTGLIQAYIFAVLATVYLSSATEAQERINADNPNQEKGD